MIPSDGEHVRRCGCVCAGARMRACLSALTSGDDEGTAQCNEFSAFYGAPPEQPKVMSFFPSDRSFVPSDNVIAATTSTAAPARREELAARCVRERVCVCAACSMINLMNY